MSGHTRAHNGRSISSVSHAGDGIRAINFPRHGQMRIRRIVTRSRMRPTGKYPSWKTNRMLEWESPHELNALRLLDCNCKVVSFQDQPCEIVYVRGGEQSRHYPDILVEFASNNRKELWEVKVGAEASRPDVALRTTFLTEHLPRWGYQYRMILANELSIQPRLRNSCTLLDFGRSSISEDEREWARLAVNNGRPLTWAAACAGQYGPKGREVLCRLVLEGALSIDLNSCWSKTTTFVPEGGAR
jgi:hypothetical protein